ncbi:hypothetical protein [Liquorilactobacillus cacaonum]|uniref:Uncharacterized protein n=1 Tax=Liquorilactobacillus cacaonum DSM 21116 TaxID=1423729 RepID=A0A0R2CH13_9LACO|nr:hypothetical protein [Liquorilactobacillus cacaonum]KRM90597.1 hypothetical protein FC80_GL000586 [Liquorilactobacillus cacaonum DSM 21116]
MTQKTALLSLTAVGIFSLVGYLSRNKIIESGEKAKEVFASAKTVKNSYDNLLESIEKLKKELPNSQKRIEELSTIISEYQFKIKNNLDNITKFQENL